MPEEFSFFQLVYGVNVQVSKFLDQYLLQLGKYIIGELSGTLIWFSPSHFSPVGDIRILSIPSILPAILHVFCHKEDIQMQSFKVPELFLSHILSLLFLAWDLRHWGGVKHDYHVILTFPYTLLHLFLLDPLGPMSVCRKFAICLQPVYFMAIVDRPHTSFKSILPNSVTWNARLGM